MTATEPKTDIVHSDIDFTDAKVFDNAFELYKDLRATGTLVRDDANDLWVATRHEDVFNLSRDNELYASRYGVRPVIAGEMSLITLDGDEHTRQRRLINQGFTPKQVRTLIPHMRELSNQIIDDIGERGEIDFVEDFAIHVPLIIICELMGLDPETRLKMYRWSDDMMDGDGHVDPDSPQLQAAAVAFGEYAEVCVELIAERRADGSADDLIGVLTGAFDAGDLETRNLDRDGKPLQGVDENAETDILAGLDDEQLLSFLVILVVAGNETTRNAISGGLLALSLFPEQKQEMLEHLDDDPWMDLAVDEIIRWVTPVLSFIRTVTRDHTYNGIELKKGDRVFMIYPSANRDEEVFENPEELDLQRNPNPHLAFGIGPHYCLGANLARAEVKTVFQELLKRLPDIKVTDDAPLSRGDSSLVIAIQELPAEFTPESQCPVDHTAMAAGAAD